MGLHGVNNYSIVLYCLFFLIGCKAKPTCNPEPTYEYETKKEYNVKQGELFNIYFTSNSAFIFCFKFEELKKIKLVNEKTITPEQEIEQCMGGNVIDEYKFLAKEKGVDTLKYARLAPLINCNDTIASKHIYKIIIRIK